MSGSDFYIAGGTLRPDAASYVERSADRELLKQLSRGEFCYVLTARQMGKSSLMVRTARALQSQGVAAAVLDLTAIGQNVTPEQWYDGLQIRLGSQLGIEDMLEDYWQENLRLGPCQRWFAALENCVLPALSARRKSGSSNLRLVVFIDELDVVKSLPFATEEFFAALRESHFRAAQNGGSQMTFCLLGVAAPHELMRDPKRTPFNVGCRIELADFTPAEAQVLAHGLDHANLPHPLRPGKVLERVLYWTSGHPYLTQRLFRAVLEAQPSVFTGEEHLVDELCHDLFLSPRAGDADDNLVFVRERLLRAQADLVSILDLYDRLLRHRTVPDDPEDSAVSELLLAGVARVNGNWLVPRNRIYETVFDVRWVAARKPVAELEMADGRRLRVKETCSLGRVESNDIVLPDVKVSRRHALIRKEGADQLWLVDLGSRNGTCLNGEVVMRPMLLRDQDRIEIGRYQLVVHQPGAVRQPSADLSNTANTVIYRAGESTSEFRPRPH